MVKARRGITAGWVIPGITQFDASVFDKSQYGGKCGEWAQKGIG